MHSIYIAGRKHGGYSTPEKGDFLEASEGSKQAGGYQKALSSVEFNICFSKRPIASFSGLVVTVLVGTLRHYRTAQARRWSDWLCSLEGSHTTAQRFCNGLHEDAESPGDAAELGGVAHVTEGRTTRQ